MTQEEAEEFAGRILAQIDREIAGYQRIDPESHMTRRMQADRDGVEADLAAIKRWWFDIHGAKLGPSNYYLNHAEGGLYRIAKVYGVQP
jgi:hypothetical protein